MKIECYMSSGCGSEDALRTNIFEALDLEGFTADVDFCRIDDKEAKSLGLKGSPSVLPDGRDIQPVSVTGFSRKLFRDESGRVMNVPSTEMIRKLIRKEKEK